MKIRFKIDQVEAFRRGIDFTGEYVTLEVDPAALGMEERCIIADRLADGMMFHLTVQSGHHGLPESRITRPLMASEPSLEGLLEACRKDDAAVRLEFGEILFETRVFAG